MPLQSYGFQPWLDSQHCFLAHVFSLTINSSPLSPYPPITGLNYMLLLFSAQFPFPVICFLWIIVFSCELCANCFLTHPPADCSTSWISHSILESICVKQFFSETCCSCFSCQLRHPSSSPNMKLLISSHPNCWVEQTWSLSIFIVIALIQILRVSFLH